MLYKSTFTFTYITNIQIQQCYYVIVRSQPAARVAITEQDTDGDDEYEDVEEEVDQSDSVSHLLSMMDSEAAGIGGSFNLSMIAEQSLLDADNNLCLSGMELIPCR